MKTLLLALILASATASAADVMPSTNRFDWAAYAGVEGGIPFRTNVYQTFNAGATSSQIQSAINSCPSNRVIVLNAGTYSLNTALRINRDGITIRGATNSAGEPTTILNFAVGGGWGLFDFSKTTYPADSGWPVTSRTVSSTLGRGTNTATLSSVSGLSVGMMLTFDQIEDGTNVNIQDSPEKGNWGRPGNRYYQQFTKVTAINGNTVTFTPPLFGDYWDAAQTPQAYYFGTALSGVTVFSGVEDVKIVRQNANGSHSVTLGPGMNCWARNVWSQQAAIGHFRFAYSVFCEARDCVATLHDSYSSATYAFYMTMSTGARVENCIVYDSPCIAGLMSISGSVLAYNFSTNIHVVDLDTVPECIMTHGGHNYANILEGNFFPAFWMDFLHGSSSHMSLVRNFIPGWETGRDHVDGQARPFNQQEHQDRHAAIGNVLGTDGKQSSYANIFWHDDALSYSTLTRKGNYNTVDGGIHSDEALGGNTISNSYIYASKPSWFGNRPWPPVVPTNAPVSAMNIPAGYRFWLGAWPPVDQPPPVSRVRVRLVQ